MKQEVKVNEISCPNCGGRIKVARNFTGSAVCEFCGSTLYLDGLNVNGELLRKNDINSGVPLSGSSSQFTRIIAGRLTDAEFVRPDILGLVTVLEEHHISVPAFLILCSSSATYTYDAGNERLRQKVEGYGTNAHVVSSEYTEWTHMNGTVTATGSYIACGNAEYSDIVNSLYMGFDTNNLIDVEELDYPEDVLAPGFNLPLVKAFDQVVKPCVRDELLMEAENALSGSEYDNLYVGNASIQRDSETRVSLGIYEIVCDIDGVQATFYFDGTGNRCYTDYVPQPDRLRMDFDAGKTEEKKHLKNEGKIFMVLTIVSGILFLCSVSAVLPGALCILTLSVSLYLCIKKDKEYHAAKAEIGKQIDANRAITKAVRNGFIEGNYTFSGIYSDGRDFDYREFAGTDYALGGEAVSQSGKETRTVPEVPAEGAVIATGASVSENNSEESIDGKDAKLTGMRAFAGVICMALRWIVSLFLVLVMLVMLIEGIGKNSASYIIHSAIHIPMIAVACPLTEKKLQKYAWFTGNRRNIILVATVTFIILCLCLIVIEGGNNG